MSTSLAVRAGQAERSAFADLRPRRPALSLAGSPSRRNAMAAESEQERLLAVMEEERAVKGSASSVASPA